MSKYSTEVRFICEDFSGLNESAGFSDIDKIISKSWNKVFTTNVEFFDEKYRKVLCSKILKHYYTREIGCEVVGLWKLWMNTKLEEIMPYYNQMYKSALLEFNPFDEIDWTKEHTGSSDRKTETEHKIDTNRIGDSNTSGKDHRTNSGTDWDLYSDTPQGGLTGVRNETYLTNARKDTTERVSDGTESKVLHESGVVNESGKNKGTDNLIDNYFERYKGKQSSVSYSTRLLEFRKTFLNIDMMVIEEFSDLFMLLW